MVDGAVAVATSATCETLVVTGGYGYMAGTYTEEGSRNGESLYVSEDRSSEIFFSEYPDNRRRTRRERRALLPLDVIPGKARASVDIFAFRGAVRAVGVVYRSFGE